MGMIDFTNDLNKAIKQKNKIQTRVLRMILSEVKYASNGLDEKELSDSKILSVIGVYRKKLFDSISSYNDSIRIDELNNEIEIVDRYLARVDDKNKISTEAISFPS